MVITTWCELVNGRWGYSKHLSKIKFPINIVKCDDCNHIYNERFDKTNKRFEKNEKDLCKNCVKEKEAKRLSEVGKKALSKISKKDRTKNAKLGGEASSLNHNNSGRFSTERWESMSKKEQNKQVTRANKALHDKLNSDEEFRLKHYLKIFKNSKIGFTSKGHNELHDFLKEYGFKQHHVIDKLEVDECNVNRKIVVEYNGDLYHCNPRKYDGDYYNTAIKMICSDKWEKDRKRTWLLKRKGYKVFVVWEDDWYKNREKIKNRLNKFINNEIKKDK